MLKLLLLVSAIFLSSIAAVGAEECEGAQCLLSTQVMDSYRCLTHKAGVVDENGRKTEEEFAGNRVPVSAVQNRFSPTGILKCDGSELSAQLTGTTGVLTTAGHGFFEMETCRPISKPESCTFTVKIGNVVRKSRVTGLEGTGIECPKKPRSIDDWAVLKIDPPLDGITPYEVPEDLEIKEGQELISISAQSRDFYRIDPKTKKKYLPKSIEECQAKKVHGIQRTSLIESDCDFGKGNSGGSLLRVVGGRDVLVGISTGNRESEADLRKAERRGTPNTGNFESDTWTTYHVPLNSKFLDTVKKAMLDRPI